MLSWKTKYQNFLLKTNILNFKYQNIDFETKFWLKKKLP